MKTPTCDVMNRIIGIVICLGVGVLAAISFQTAATGSAEGHPDVTFWWIIIGIFLAVASVGGVIGTWIHTRQDGA